MCKNPLDVCISNVNTHRVLDHSLNSENKGGKNTCHLAGSAMCARLSLHVFRLQVWSLATRIRDFLDLL